MSDSSTSRPRRVLFLNENLGGHATMHLHLRRAVSRRADIAAEVVDVPPPGLAARIGAAQVPGLARLDLDLQPLRDQLLRSVRARRVLRDGARGFDALHCYTQHACLLSADILRAYPTVVSTDATGVQVASMHPQRRPALGTPVRASLTRRFEQRVLAAATLVVCHTDWARASMHRDYGIDDEKLRIIPFGIEIPRVPPPRPLDRPLRIGFVAASMERKGGWRLLQVFRERLRDRCELVLVTRDPVPAEPGVTVLSDVTPGDPRLLATLEAIDVLAMPTEIEAFGYAIIEAMASGAAVVATRTDGIPDVVEDGVSGLLVDPGERPLAEALERLADDRALCARLGAAARRQAEARFDARSTTGRLVEVIEEACGIYRAASRSRSSA